jgi:hypothetical protein
MNDRTHSDPNASSQGPQEKHETIVLFEKLQELRDALRKVGVVRVVATYEKNALLVAFLNSQETPILLPDIDTVADELARLLAIVVRRRCPEGTPRQAHTGSFNWDLVEDVLTHKHTVTFKGLP